ncbi:MAG: hypothetical protein KJP23_23785, partial [Deltaproteobacteria bacterium]|nr:hypothetical protein [Deltaproteobacteria bacterium]
MKKQLKLYLLAMTAATTLIAGSANVIASDIGQGYDQGVKAPGFIMKYKKPPEFIHHKAPEPGDVAFQYEWQRQRPSTDFPFEYKFVEVEGSN